MCVSFNLNPLGWDILSISITPSHVIPIYCPFFPRYRTLLLLSGCHLPQTAYFWQNSKRLLNELSLGVVVLKDFTLSMDVQIFVYTFCCCCWSFRWRYGSKTAGLNGKNRRTYPTPKPQNTNSVWRKALTCRKLRVRGSRWPRNRAITAHLVPSSSSERTAILPLRVPRTTGLARLSCAVTISKWNL